VCSKIHPLTRAVPTRSVQSPQPSRSTSSIRVTADPESCLLFTRKALAAPDQTASVECSAPTMRVERKYCVYAQPAMPILLMRTQPSYVEGKLAQQGPQRNCYGPYRREYISLKSPFIRQVHSYGDWVGSFYQPAFGIGIKLSRKRLAHAGVIGVQPCNFGRGKQGWFDQGKVDRGQRQSLE
jgi:hypothetical protein